MAIELVTGVGTSDHVDSDDFGSLQAAMFGEGCYVLNRNSKFKATKASDTRVHIGSGDAIMYGRHVRIKYSDAQMLQIENGASGRRRMDLIVIRYHMNMTDGTEYATLEVIKGTPSASNPQIPEHYEGNMLKNSYQVEGNERVVDMPLYIVHLSGVSIQKIEHVFTVQPSFLNEIGNYMYPVGSIYLSTSDKNPALLFGGAWEAYGQGRTLIGVGEYTDRNGTSVDFVEGRTGGEYNHKLTVNEIPKHTHNYYSDVEWERHYMNVVYEQTSLKRVIENIYPKYDTNATSQTGGDIGHNNVMPYITCYMWKRIG